MIKRNEMATATATWYHCTVAQCNYAVSNPTHIRRSSPTIASISCRASQLPVKAGLKVVEMAVWTRALHLSPDSQSSNFSICTATASLRNKSNKSGTP